MTTPDPATPAKSDFLAAEEIKGILRGRDKGEQERIIRWVSESLDLTIGPSKAKPDHAPAHHPSPTPPVGSAPTRHPASADRAKDIRSFVQEKQPKSDVQFVVVVAYYYSFMAPGSERKEAITSDDLQTAARLAQRSVFKTPSQPLNNSVGMGYMDRAGRGEYRLNAVGENLVAMTLPGTGTGGENGRRPAKKRKTSKNTGVKKTKRSA